MAADRTARRLEPNALTDSKVPTEIADELERRGSGVRILLFRQRSASRDGPVFYQAHSQGAFPSLVKSPLSDPSALLDVDFEALANGKTGPGVPVDDPTYLVCTHGRHDICCADKGRPLYRALSGVRPSATWEVSHLGGDRFAGNLLILPRGDYFGRVEPEDVELVVSRYEGRRLDLAHHRGRSIQLRLVRAAEHFVLESERLDGFDDLTVTDYLRQEPDRAEVVFERPGGSITVEVAAHKQPEMAYLTCRAEEPGQPIGYELVSLTRETN